MRVELVNPTSAQIQGLLDSDAVDEIDIYAPEGVFLSKDKVRSCLDLGGVSNKIINIHGKLALDPQTYGNDTHIFNAESAYSNVTIVGGILDGSADLGAEGSEQMHAINVNAAGDRLIVKGTQFQNLVGDGAKIASATETSFVRCSFDDIGRGGITVQHHVNGMYIRDCTFRTISDQSVDFEPSVSTIADYPRHVQISGCIMEHADENETVALTLTHGIDISVRDCLIYGNVQGVSCSQVHMENVRIHSSYDSSVVTTGLEFTRLCDELYFYNVHVVQRTDTSATRFVYNSSAVPSNIVWIGGSITQPFVKTAMELTSAKYLRLDSVKFIGPDDTANAIQVDNNLGANPYLSVTNCQFIDWNRAGFVDRGTVDHLFWIGNYYENTANHLVVDGDATVTDLVESLNGA